MTGREGLEALVACGAFPAECVEDLLRVCDFVETKLDAGELSHDEADAILTHHAARIIASLVATQGDFTEEQIETSKAVGLALRADGAPS